MLRGRWHSVERRRVRALFSIAGDGPEKTIRIGEARRIPEAQNGLKVLREAVGTDAFCTGVFQMQAGHIPRTVNCEESWQYTAATVASLLHHEAMVCGCCRQKQRFNQVMPRSFGSPLLQYGLLRRVRACILTTAPLHQIGPIKGRE